MTVDGLFGEGMEVAIKAFQDNENLELSGYLDLKTKQRIKERVRDYIITGEQDFQLEKAKEILLKNVKKITIKACSLYPKCGIMNLLQLLHILFKMILW